MVLTFQRNANGQISGILADGQPVVNGVGYLPFGPAKDKTLGNGMMVSETFDDRYQLSRIQAGTVADYRYVRDAAGNITSSTGFQTPKITASDAGGIQYDYMANHLVSMSCRSYVYDSDGNILSDGIRTFEYNQDNRLVRVSIGGVVVGEYAYDAFGRRVKKVASGVTTLYHYAGGSLIAETDENGNPQRDYIHLNGEPLALRIYGAQFGTVYWFVNDHLGTPQKIVDSTGQVVWAAAYLPFGKTQVKPATIENNLRFPGQYFDNESGLHYNWHRYYDPDTGRYITADPIGLSGGINLYSYVLNNPVNLSDPEGLLVVPCDPAAYAECEARCTAYGTTVSFCYKILILPVVACKCTTEDSCISKNASKPTKMQQEVERGQAPRDVERVDRPHVKDQQPHVHYKDGTSSNSDGTVHDKHKGVPNPSNKVNEWLNSHGWSSPK